VYGLRYNDDVVRQPPMRVNLRKRSGHTAPPGPRTSPGGTFESSPVRSAGSRFFKINASRSGRSMTFCAPEIGREPSAEHFDRPCRDGPIFRTISRHFVPGYYQMSLRDWSSTHPILMLTHMGGGRIGYVRRGGCALLLPVRLGPPCRRPILNATTSPSFVRRYTSSIGAQSDIPMSFAEGKMRVTR
jgi:hypothetical protein